MDLAKYRCLNCGGNNWSTYTTFWRCESCGHRYPCISGVPRLFLEARVGQQDKGLRDKFYGGFFGAFYGFMMPFLSLPVRPFARSRKEWIAYLAIISGFGFMLWWLAELFLVRGVKTVYFVDALVTVAFVLAVYFLIRNRYIFDLMVLAIPVWVSLRFSDFEPDESFTDLHSRLVAQYQLKDRRLAVLDISTGTCNSLFRHGWMELNAEYTGLDLSETMLLQGARFMTERQVPMDFVLGDAMELPFESEKFDIVLNYGAVNGMTDPRQAISEMARVCKKGGLVFFLDEQLYDSASFIEKKYFQSVLSRHNVVHRCPVELLPPELGNIEVKQVYHFYYVCTAIKI